MRSAVAWVRRIPAISAGLCFFGRSSLLIALLAPACSSDVNDAPKEAFTPDPIECPEGAEPRLFRFTETRIQNRQPLSAVGWRCFRVDGTRDGPSMEWFADGQLSAVTNWSKGEKHGRFEMWHPNGQKKVEGEHDHWQAVGHWTMWDEDGNVVSEKDFGRPGEKADVEDAPAKPVAPESVAPEPDGEPASEAPKGAPDAGAGGPS